MKAKLVALGAFAALSVATVATPALADGEDESSGPWSASVSLTSDYRFRGISQTDNDPAVQGSIDFQSDSGIFAGIWASNIDFNDPGESSLEVDLTLGFSHAFSEMTEGSLKLVYYAYPDQDNALPDYGYFEIIAGLSHNFGGASISAEVAWSPDYFAEVGDALALTGGLTVPICDKLWFFDGGIEASAHVGHQWFDEPLLIDYMYYDLGLSATVAMFTLDARWVDTDLSQAECGGLDICDSDFVFTATVAFGG